MNERSIFLEALDKGTPAARSAYLEQACGGDAALRQRLEALLASHERAGSFLGMPAPQRLAEQLATPQRAAATPGQPPGADADTQSFAPGGTTVGRRAPASARALSGAPHLPGYEILGVLGQGGMGVVYKAQYLRLDRTVALKMLPANTEVAEEHLARFRAEAEAVARLEHPNIVQLYEVIEHDGRPCLALEYVPGVSLHERLKGEPLSVEGAARLVETLARAIHYAHQHGIVHRDLKPANVLLQRTAANRADGAALPGIWLPKITDFGLAKRLDADQGQTPSGAILGTPSYMAPEQARGTSKRSGPAADIYSLGAILYELLVGHPPFQGETLVDTLVKAVSQKPVAPRRLEADIPTELERICLKCLQKEPAQRYASAAALAEDLSRFLAGGPVSDGSPSPAVPEQGPVRVSRRRRRLVLAGGVAALLLVGLTLLFLEASRRGALAVQDRQPPLRVALPFATGVAEQAKLLAQNGQKSPPPQEGKEPRRENGKEQPQKRKEAPPPQAAGKKAGTDPGGRLPAPPALPDLQFSIPMTPVMGRLAVQASPKVHARYADGRGAIALVLDCSGSMAAKQPDGTTRFDQARRALKQVLTSIPHGTQVSVWVFSQQFDVRTGANLGNAEPEDTIQRLYFAKKWDKKMLGELGPRIDQLSSFNETPIVRAMMEARKDFTDVQGFKTMVILTDGTDNRFEPRGNGWRGDPVYNPNGQHTIPKFLAERFGKGSDILVRIIGFQLPAAERPMVERQFRGPLGQFPRKGRFYNVTRTDQLIEALKESVRQRLFFSLQDNNGQPVKGYRGGVDINMRGTNPRPIELPPGYYYVDVESTQLRQKIEIKRGDYLRLNLYQTRDGFVLQRDLVEKSFPGASAFPTRETKGWRVTVLQNERKTTEDAAEKMVAIEYLKDRAFGGEGVLSQVTPSLVLFQVRRADKPEAPMPSLRFRPLAAYAAPSWELQVRPWGRDKPPQLEVFWSEDPPEKAKILRRGQHFKPLDEKWTILPAGAEFKAVLNPFKGEEGSLRLLSLRTEKHTVVTYEGKRRKEVSCFVVRMAYPPGKPVMVQLPGFNGGQEHQFNNAAGKYTGIFWEMTAQEAQQRVESLSVIALDGFRAAALSSGQYARIDLRPPDLTPRPPPE